MSEQLPDVALYDPRLADAVSMVAAMIYEQRLEGILEGLRFAGVLNAPSKRSSSPKTDEHKPGDQKR